MFGPFTYQNRFKRIAKILITLTVACGLLTLGKPLSASAPMAIPNVKLRSASQLRTEAGWYDTAFKEISRISTIKLSTVEELAQANAIVDKNVSNLRYNRSKLVTLGLSDSTFINAVKAKAFDSKSAEQFAAELANDPTSILKISGGQALADRLRRNLDADVAKIRQIAAQVRNAALDVKAKLGRHHGLLLGAQSRSSNGVHTALIATTPQLTGAQSVQLAFIVIIVAMVAVPLLGPAIFLLTELTVNLVFNIGTEDGKNRVAACQEEIDARYRRCINEAASLGLLKVPAEAICYADWLLGSADCLVS